MNTTLIMALDSFVADVKTACSSGDGSPQYWKEAVERISNSKVEALLDQNAADLPKALEALNPELHTIGWIAILSALDREGRTEATAYTQQMAQFAASFSAEQARAWPDRTKKIFRSYTNFLVANNLPSYGVLVLRTALERFRPSAETITPLHAMLALLCLLSRMHSVMLPILAEDITRISPAETATDAEDVLLYLYYGGTVYLGLRRFREAEDMFASAISAPAQAASAIAVEAYKKFVLVGLINWGKPALTPKNMSSHVIRALASMCKPYQKIAEAFSKYNRAELAKAIAQSRKLLTDDSNMGLAQECESALVHCIVQRLTRTFLTLSLAEIARHAGLESAAEAQAVILNMVESGKINAKISQTDEMVSFQDSSEHFDTAAAIEVLDQHIGKVLSINDKLAAADTAVLTSSAYQLKLRLAKKSEKMPPGISGGSSSSFGALPMDRDVFAD